MAYSQLDRLIHTKLSTYPTQTETRSQKLEHKAFFLVWQGSGSQDDNITQSVVPFS